MRGRQAAPTAETTQAAREEPVHERYASGLVGGKGDGTCQLRQSTGTGTGTGTGTSTSTGAQVSSAV